MDALLQQELANMDAWLQQELVSLSECSSPRTSDAGRAVCVRGVSTSRATVDP